MLFCSFNGKEGYKRYNQAYAQYGRSKLYAELCEQSSNLVVQNLGKHRNNKNDVKGVQIIIARYGILIAKQSHEKTTRLKVPPLMNDLGLGGKGSIPNFV